MPAVANLIINIRSTYEPPQEGSKQGRKQNPGTIKTVVEAEVRVLENSEQRMRLQREEGMFQRVVAPSVKYLCDLLPIIHRAYDFMFQIAKSTTLLCLCVCVCV